MGFRRRFIGFTGAVQILLTLAMFIMTSFILSSAGNAAVGTPLWGALVILMCGAGNIIHALESPSKKRDTQDGLLPHNCNCGTTLANMTAFIVSGIILGIFSSALWLSTSINALAVPFSTIVLAASFICIFSLIALFADCFAICFGPEPPHQTPYFADYAGPPRGIPNQGPVSQRVPIDPNQSQYLY